jgi:cyclopropane fatty-acyl-phospholipid synthase-like methyltransferase
MELDVLGSAIDDIGRLPKFKYDITADIKYARLIRKKDEELSGEEKAFMRKFEEEIVRFWMKAYNYTEEQAYEHVKNIKKKFSKA